MTASFRKGDLVRLSSHWSNSLKVVPRRSRTLAWRPLTSDEQARLVAALDPAGVRPRWIVLTHLAPLYETVDVEPDGVWVVQRSRCGARQGYHTVSGCAQLLDTKTGISFYIRREGLVPV